jgi:hypothetical protein
MTIPITHLIAAMLLLLIAAVGQAPPVGAQRPGVATATATARRVFLLEPLVNRSPAELGDYVVRMTLSSGVVRAVGGTPEVLLARPILATELAPLGLTDLRNFDNEPPLVLAILRGTFIWARAFEDPNETFRYAGFIFNASTGAPIVEQVSGSGAPFRYALNDPNLPLSTEVVPATPRPRLPGGRERFTMPPDWLTPRPRATGTPTASPTAVGGPATATPAASAALTAIPGAIPEEGE